MKIYITKTKELLLSLNEVEVNNEELKLLEAKTADKTTEKHVPVVTRNENEVNVVVGETLHPMTEEHQIMYVIVETKNMTYIKKLESSEEPKATFKVDANEEIIAVYEYCNLHGLWMTKEV